MCSEVLLGPTTLPSVLQESISDFYWFYSGKDIIDDQGQRNFSKAINVAKQVFNTLTEYIQVRRSAPGHWFSGPPAEPLLVLQGPCTGNQQSLAHSRLWDAVVGFLHVFAHMQMKLSQVSVQHQVLCGSSSLVVTSGSSRWQQGCRIQPHWIFLRSFKPFC